jgi:hypothetical protein
MKIQELIVAAIVFGAVYYLGNKFFKKKKDNSCGCDNDEKCNSLKTSGNK